MAISYVGGVVAGRTGNSNSTVNVSLSSGLTGGSDAGVSAGDLVVVTVCTGSAARASNVAVSGYTNLTVQRTTTTTYDTNVQTSYKIMGSTPDSVVTIPAQGNAADGQAYAVQVFRGVDTTTPLDVTPTYATGTDVNNNPNPAQITPSTAGAWIIACGGGAAAAGTTLYTTATLTAFLSANGADTNDGTVGVGYYDAWTSGAYDPAAFGGGSTNAANSWGATTIALRPLASVNTDIAIATGGFVLSGAAPTVSLSDNKNIAVDAGVLEATGQDPITAKTDIITIAVDAGALSLEGLDTNSVNTPPPAPPTFRVGGL